MSTYSVLLQTGYRADCEGNRISQAMNNLANKRPDLIPIMTSCFITYINGVSLYGFRQTEESRRQLKRIKKSLGLYDA